MFAALSANPQKQLLKDYSSEERTVN